MQIQIQTQIRDIRNNYTSRPIDKQNRHTNPQQMNMIEDTHITDKATQFVYVPYPPPLSS